MADAGEFVADESLAGLVVARPCFKGGGHARGGLRVDGVKFDQPISQQRVALARGVVKACVIGGERGDDGAKAVGVFPIKISVFGKELGDVRGMIGGGHADLQAEPFVHHEAVVLPLGVELGEFGLAHAVVQKDGERAELFGHGFGILVGMGGGCCVDAGHERQEAQAESAVARSDGAGGKIAGGLMGGDEAGQVGFQVIGEVGLQGAAGRVDRCRVGDVAACVQGLGDVIIAGQAQGEGAKSGVERGFARDGGDGGEPVVRGRGLVQDMVRERGFGEGAAGLAFIERVGVMGQQDCAVGVGLGLVQHHGGGKTA